MRLREFLLGFLAVLCSYSAKSFAEEPESGASPIETKRFFEQRGKIVITFIGYSDAGYEDVAKMLDDARNVLSVHSPKRTIVNIGGTSSGIGAVYELAKKMGFETTGIVSSQAKKFNAEISPHADKVFHITDETWGGFLENTQVLSPTSLAMVECSDIVVGIGGGAVGRDEMIAARREGKTVKFIPADMNHKVAIDKARKKGLPAPTDFKGSAFEVFGRSAKN